MSDFFYSPCALTIPAGTPVALTLINEGFATGNLVIDELGVKTDDLLTGQTVDVVIDAPPGVYAFYSDWVNQRAAGRAGILTVVDTNTPVAATPMR